MNCDITLDYPKERADILLLAMTKGDNKAREELIKRGIIKESDA